ncbi:hypothetical protein [Bradyrhizobium canariense]|uniref:hypothetical protein n=1 Tax=Bradyrhizobium canariense TaxID=255045 RepID=UPI0030829168
MLRRLHGEGIADKELSALLARDLLVPIVHGTTYEALREISPLLASRSGLSTAENPMADVAAKLAELVAPYFRRQPAPGLHKGSSVGVAAAIGTSRHSTSSPPVFFFFSAR